MYLSFYRPLLFLLICDLRVEACTPQTLKYLSKPMTVVRYICNRIATMIIRGTAWWSSLYFSSVPHVVTKYLIVVSERGSLYTNESLTVCHKKYTKSLSLLLYFKLVSVNTATPVYTRKILDLMRLKYVKCSIESVALKQIISQHLDEFMSGILRSEIESAEKYIVG